MKDNLQQDESSMDVACNPSFMWANCCLLLTVSFRLCSDVSFSESTDWGKESNLHTGHRTRGRRLSLYPLGRIAYGITLKPSTSLCWPWVKRLLKRVVMEGYASCLTPTLFPKYADITVRVDIISCMMQRCHHTFHFVESPGLLQHWALQTDCDAASVSNGLAEAQRRYADVMKRRNQWTYRAYVTTTIKLKCLTWTGHCEPGMCLFQYYVSCWGVYVKINCV